MFKHCFVYTAYAYTAQSTENLDEIFQIFSLSLGLKPNGTNCEIARIGVLKQSQWQSLVWVAFTYLKKLLYNFHKIVSNMQSVLKLLVISKSHTWMANTCLLNFSNLKNSFSSSKNTSFNPSNYCFRNNSDSFRME